MESFLRNYKIYILTWKEQCKIEETKSAITLPQLEENKSKYQKTMDQLFSLLFKQPIISDSIYSMLCHGVK